MNKFKLLISLCLGLLISTELYSQVNIQNTNLPSESEKIEYLLNEIGVSDGLFIRNGDPHSSQDAQKHLAHKLKTAKKMFWFFGPERKISVKEFIEKIASKSSTSGKPYYIQFGEAPPRELEQWLNETLQNMPNHWP